MMPRLDAGEQLAAMRVQGLAFGSFEKPDAERMQRELSDKALGVSPDGHAAQVKRATPAQLSAMGIGVSRAVQEDQGDG